jgi:hypothetical protein
MFEERGTPYQTPAEMERLFKDAGFVDIRVIQKSIPIGGWSEGVSLLLLS